MTAIYQFSDYQKSTPATLVREGLEYQRRRQEAVYLVDALVRWGDEADVLQRMLELGTRDPSYGAWEGEIESFLHMAEVALRNCQDQLKSVAKQARNEPLVTEMLKARRESYRLEMLESLWKRSSADRNERKIFPTCGDGPGES